ncbi:MAG: hypothetical protein IPJ36_15740 [Simplicispira sp.]|nr:hypothetical protein [Simplicispira sp.]
MRATEHSYKCLLETEGRIKKELIAKGMVITDPADGEKEWIDKATTTVWPKFYTSIGGKDKPTKSRRLWAADGAGQGSHATGALFPGA